VAFARVVASGAFFPPQREVASLPARQEAAGALPIPMLNCHYAALDRLDG
jgi:hypothetical protein